MAVVRQLTLLQIDPTAAIAPSADLVAWNRLGRSYQPSQLKHALEHDRTLVEFNAMVRPMSDLSFLLAGAKTWPRHERPREWLRRNEPFRRDILVLLGFAYTLEMYKPKSARRWGYFALPVLHHNRLVGKVDAAADRRSGALVVHAIHEDVSFTPAMRSAVRAAIEELAGWLNLTIQGPGTASPRRSRQAACT